jgi:hypothetical protein
MPYDGLSHAVMHLTMKTEPVFQKYIAKKSWPNQPKFLQRFQRFADNALDDLLLSFIPHW